MPALLLALLGNLKTYLYLGGAIALFSAGVYIRGDWDASKLKSALESQETALTAQCDKDKVITKEANDALQKNLDIITAKLNSAKRLHPSVCITPITSTSNISSNDGKHAGQNGISSDWFRDYAAQCESIRQIALICEKFVDDIETETGK